MPIKDQNNLTIVRAAAGKLIPENAELVLAPNDLTSLGIFDGISAPITLPSKDAGQVSAPNDLTFQSQLPFNGSRILTQTDYVIETTFSGGFNNGLASGEILRRILSENTYEAAEDQGPPSNGTQWSFGLSFPDEDPVNIDSIAISAHNLGDIGATIDVYTDPDPNVILDSFYWAQDMAIESNQTIFLAQPSPIAAYSITVIVRYAGGQSFRLGNLMFGNRIELPKIYGGQAPSNLNHTVEYQSNKTGTGNFVGRSIKRAGANTSFRFQHLDPYFARDTLLPFIRYAERRPFVMQWRPDFFPEEAIYCWTTDDPQLSNMGGGHDLMQMNMNVEAYRGL